MSKVSKSFAFSTVALSVFGALATPQMAAAFGEEGHRALAAKAMEFMESQQTTHYARQAIDLIRENLAVHYEGGATSNWIQAKEIMRVNASDFDDLKSVYLCDGSGWGPYNKDCAYHHEIAEDFGYNTNYGSWTHFINFRSPGAGYNWGNEYGGYDFRTHRPVSSYDERVYVEDLLDRDIGGLTDTWLAPPSYVGVTDPETPTEGIPEGSGLYRITAEFGDAATYGSGTVDYYDYYEYNFSDFEEMVFPPLDDTLAMWYQNYIDVLDQIDFSRKEILPNAFAWQDGTCSFNNDNNVVYQGVAGSCLSGVWYDNNELLKKTAQRYLGYLMHATDVAVAHHVHNSLSWGHGDWEDIVNGNVDFLYSLTAIQEVQQTLGQDLWLSHCKYPYDTKNARSNGLKEAIEVVAEYTYNNPGHAFYWHYDISDATVPGSAIHQTAEFQANLAIQLATQMLTHGGMALAKRLGDTETMYDMCH